MAEGLEIADGTGDAAQRPEVADRRDPGVTPRSIAFGLCLSVAVSLLANSVRYIFHGSYMAFSQLPMSNLILFLLSLLGCALLARWFGGRWAFSPAEWITVFCLGFTSTLGPTYGISGTLIGMIGTPYYFATPENRWAEFIHPHLPSWLIPKNDGGAMTWFYEGLPAGASIPWDAWLVPLFWWFAFFCALGLACACVSIIIHRQWSEHEKVVYPMMVPVVEMASGGGTGKRALPEFMKGKLFWTGFGMTTFVFWWNMISWFYPQFPTFPTAQGTWLWLPSKYPPVLIFLSTVVLCFAYFASLEVLLSIWVFDLLFVIEGGVLNRLGVAATTPHYATGRYTWQSTGAFTALVLWWLWMSRGHLRAAFQKALHPGRSPMDDSRELLSYRGAFIGLTVSCLYIVAWLAKAGMEGKLIVLLIPTMFLIYLGLAKVLAESGMLFIRPPTPAGRLSILAFGSDSALQVSTHTILALCWQPLNHFKGFAVTVMVHVNRLGDFVPKDKRRLFWGICAAFVIGMVASTFYTIWLGYTIGGYNFLPNWLTFAGRWTYRRAINRIVSPTPLETEDYLFFIGGAAAMIALNLMRYRFTWWPLHPVGFALSGTSLFHRTSTTIFIAWLAKFLTIRLAGASFYRKSKPLFIGLLAGFILAVAAGIVVDAIWFPSRGHIVHKPH